MAKVRDRDKSPIGDLLFLLSGSKKAVSYDNKLKLCESLHAMIHEALGCPESIHSALPYVLNSALVAVSEGQMKIALSGYDACSSGAEPDEDISMHISAVGEVIGCVSMISRLAETRIARDPKKRSTIAECRKTDNSFASRQSRASLWLPKMPAPRTVRRYIHQTDATGEPPLYTNEFLEEFSRYLNSDAGRSKTQAAINEYVETQRSMRACVATDSDASGAITDEQKSMARRNVVSRFFSRLFRFIWFYRITTLLALPLTILTRMLVTSAIYPITSLQPTGWTGLIFTTCVLLEAIAFFMTFTRQQGASLPAGGQADDGTVFRSKTTFSDGLKKHRFQYSLALAYALVILHPLSSVILLDDPIYHEGTQGTSLDSASMLSKSWKSIADRFDKSSACRELQETSSGGTPTVRTCTISSDPILVSGTDSGNRFIMPINSDSIMTADWYFIEIQLRNIGNTPLSTCGLRVKTNQGDYLFHVIQQSHTSGKLKGTPEAGRYQLEVLELDTPETSESSWIVSTKMHWESANLPFVKWQPHPWNLGWKYSDWTKLAIFKMGDELNVFVDDVPIMFEKTDAAWAHPSAVLVSGASSTRYGMECVFDRLKVKSQMV